jgi:hypothetical protein
MPHIADESLLDEPRDEAAVRTAAAHIDHHGPPSEQVSGQLTLGGGPAQGFVRQRHRLPG